MTDQFTNTFLRPDEAAEVLGVSRRRIYQFVADGRLPSVRDRPRLFKRIDVEALAKTPRAAGSAGRALKKRYLKEVKERQRGRKRSKARRQAKSRN